MNMAVCPVQKALSQDHERGLPRSVILRQPHMEHLLDHTAIHAMTDQELAALERLMRFCGAHALADPDRIDIAAFATLAEQDGNDLTLLGQALAALAAPVELVGAMQVEADRIRHREGFDGISHRARPKERRVSVNPADLPQQWKDKLAELDRDRAFAPSILGRMRQRLCLFAWSAKEAGLPPDLTSVPALKALYRDIRSRSAGKNEDGPRFAYLRSTWEELNRVAIALGLTDDARGILTGTLNELERLEQGQTPRKFTWLAGAPQASDLIRRAGKMLEEASKPTRPDHRHARRNAAAAIALANIVPARPGDVFTHHVFGKGLHFDPGRGAWRFSYTPNKTRGMIPDPLELPLDPFWNRYIDALILQDHEPRWLGELRQAAIERQRPLYMNYDGSRCSPRWYSRIWAKHIGTGGHIARSLIYDEMSDLGELGIQYAKLVNHHRSETIPEKYRGQNAIRKSYNRGQEAMILRAGDEDISGLV
ncbi:MAG: hypothetical protein Q4G25_06560 [Paracoccus sp. (in: a-proteobacteria)]|nr:hypothetical protein [Paracoccus sp. (in: a-proteobacteria)]